MMGNIEEFLKQIHKDAVLQQVIISTDKNQKYRFMVKQIDQIYEEE